MSEGSVSFLKDRVGSKEDRFSWELLTQSNLGLSRKTRWNCWSREPLRSDRNLEARRSARWCGENMDEG